MKSLVEMSDKEFEKYLKTIQAILPVWCKDGATCSHYSHAPFQDRVGNKAYITVAHWKDKKGESKESVARVEWVNEWTD